jgi:NADPH:quinone reductase
MLGHMRAVVYSRFGDPAEVLGVQERPDPVAGPGQVRVRLILSPIHNHDLSTIRGQYGYKPPLPAVAGTEALGVVDQLGPDVTQLAVGQRVCAVGQGAWGEYFLASAATVVPVPPTLADESACQLLAMPLSAVMLIEDLEVRAGDWIVQNAANGAVGRILDLLARQREIKVVNLVRRQSTVDELTAEGVPNAIATEGPDWAAKVRATTGGAPIVRAVDSVGGQTANELLGLLAPGGTLVSFGGMSGQALVVDPGHLIFKGKTVKGFWATARTERTSAADRGRMVADLVRLVASGVLPLRVAATFDLAQAAEAAAASLTPGRTGKVALRPGR